MKCIASFFSLLFEPGTFWSYAVFLVLIFGFFARGRYVQTDEIGKIRIQNAATLGDILFICVPGLITTCYLWIFIPYADIGRHIQSSFLLLLASASVIVLIWQFGKVIRVALFLVCMMTIYTSKILMYSEKGWLLKWDVSIWIQTCIMVSICISAAYLAGKKYQDFRNRKESVRRSNEEIEIVTTDIEDKT